MSMNNYDVIFIDDEPTMTDIFQQFVNWKFKSWRACSFNDPGELYEKITSNQVSATVWIVDIMMPGRNGAELAAAIQRECAPGTVIIGYTALDPLSLDLRPEYKEGLKYFQRIINKQESFLSLLELVDAMLTSKSSA